MEKVILYGGAFNPPTNAHQLIAQAAANYATAIDADLWLMPSGERQDKAIGVPIQKRMSYAHGLLASLNTDTTTQVCDYELKSDVQTHTIETYRYLKNKYPEVEFLWLFGSDSIQTMPNWDMGSFMLRTMNFLVVQRKGHEIELQDNMTLLAVEQLDISSSMVRACINNGQSVESYLPATVLPLI